MSYRNPARIVDVQSGQHFRNMQQSLAKSFQGVIDQDTARIKAGMVKAEKEQAELRKKLQKQEDEAYRSALQANQQTNTSVRYDNMQENLSYNAHLAGKPAGSLTSEERVWMQNFKNVGSSIKTVLANIVSGREDYEKQSSIRPGQEGSIVATVDNVNKQKAYEIFLNGNGGTSHAYFDGATGETTIVAKDLEGKIVGKVTSNGDMYEFATVIVTDKDRKSNVDNLIKSRETEGIQSSVYGKNPQSIAKTDPTNGTTYYVIKPDEAATKEALRVSSLATVQSWSPDQQKNWYNSTQKGKPGFEAITGSWTEDEKYVEKEVPVDKSDPDGKKMTIMVPSPEVNKVTDAFNNQTFEENKQVLLTGKQIDRKAFEANKKSQAEINAAAEYEESEKAYNNAKKFMDENKDDLSLKGGAGTYDTGVRIKEIARYAGNLNIGVKVSPLRIGDEEKPSNIEIKGPGGAFVYGVGSTNEQIRAAILKAAVKNPNVSDNNLDSIFKSK